MPERHTWDVTYEALPPVSTFPTTATDRSYTVYYDGGPVGFAGSRGQGASPPPIENVPPRPEWGFGGDPHGYPWGSSADGIDHASTFLENGTINGCASGGLCFANGWDGVQGLP